MYCETCLDSCETTYGAFARRTSILVRRPSCLSLCHYVISSGVSRRGCGPTPQRGPVATGLAGSLLHSHQPPSYTLMRSQRISQAQKNSVVFFRHALRLVNGTLVKDSAATGQ